MTVDKALWRQEAEGIREFYGKFGDRLPDALKKELETLEQKLM